MGIPERTSLSPDEILLKSKAEVSYYEFVKQAFFLIEPERDFIDGWHIEALCDHLEGLVMGDVKNLLVNVPPGTMKSILCSVLLAPWSWINYPELRFMYASYDQSLSTRDSVASRAIIQSSWYQRLWGGRFAITTDQNEKTRYNNDKKGWRLATSVRGRGTGEHPDVIVADDPHKVKEMESRQERDTVHSWWGGTIASRGKIHNSRRCVVMQRVHEDDLSGRILSENGGEAECMADTSRWCHLNLPMLYEENRMLPTALGWVDPRKTVGELLWPAAFDAVKVAELDMDLRAVGPDVPAGQLQQRPTRRGGRFFETEKMEIVDAAPAMASRVRAWDKAATDEGGDWTAGVRVSVAEGVVYIEHVARAQIETFARNKMIKQVAKLDGSAVAIHIEQEPGSGGKDSALVSIKELAGYIVHAKPVTGSKQTRAAALAAQVHVGNVKIVRGAWNRDFILELQAFPTGSHDDQVDAASLGFLKLAAEVDVDVDGDLLASGGPDDDKRPLSPDEVDELPDFLADILTGLAPDDDYGD